MHIIFRVMVKEAVPSILSGTTLATITYLSCTTMAGAVGAGGLGAVALNYGYQSFNYMVLYTGVIILCIMAVLTAECFNTALESVVDLVSPTYADLAKHAKDAAAGAVLISAVGAVIVGCFLYIPAIIRLHS